MAEPNVGTDSHSSLVFKVKRAAPELILPAAPTPYELKELSDIDDQKGLRFLIPMVCFYKNDGGFARDPAKVIKAAVREALVPYYPFAGRLREKADDKLVVECTAEGVLFVEADADVTLDQFQGHLQPPIPCVEELVLRPGSSGILHSPLLLIQVTRLRCEGFILAVLSNHVIADAIGLCQFLNATTELARGAQLSVRPVWERHHLCARDPPRVTCIHHEFDDIAGTKATIIPSENMIYKSFFFGAGEMLALRRWVPAHMKSSSTNEVLCACLWRCRTIALELDPNQVVRFTCVANARSIVDPTLPNGYYGNTLVYPAVVCPAEELCQKPVGYALELVKKAKAQISNEYVRSTTDFLVMNGRPVVDISHSFQVSNLSQVGFDQLDYGWGVPVFSGPGSKFPSSVAFCIPLKNSKGERGMLLTMCLPPSTMDRFVKLLDSMLTQFQKHSTL